jgi:peptide/nickel transport system permease protein
MSVFPLNRRVKTLLLSLSILALLLAIAVSGLAMSPLRYSPDYSAKLLGPSLSHPFGSDYLGRDMFFRTLKGLSTSILIGALAATVSALIALTLGLIAASAGGLVDKVISYFVDLFMGVPHLVLLMLIAYAMGRGFRGVTIAVAVTHWASLSRIIRAEVLQIKDAQFVKTARKLGRPAAAVAVQHILPHVVPQFIIGLILLFPHAILHEASITFLGFGLSVDTPAIGIILSESLNHIATGKWYLVFFPGLSLVVIVMLFNRLGEQLKLLFDPASAQE